MWNSTRQRFPLYGSNVELKSTFDFTVSYVVSYHPMAASEIRTVETFWKISLGQTVGIHDKNLESKRLILF